MTQDASEPKRAKEAGGSVPPPPRAAGEPQEKTRVDLLKRYHKEEPKPPELPTYDNLGPNVPPFEKWFGQNIDYIREVQAQLQQPLDDSPAVADAQAREIEPHGARMASILAWCDGYLDVAEHLALKKMPGRDPRWFTDLDRQKTLAAAVVRERRCRDVVKGLCESIERRVSYVQSQLRFARLESQAMQ